MSLDDVRVYASRTRSAKNVAELADIVRHALDAIIREIKDLQTRVSKIER